MAPAVVISIDCKLSDCLSIICQIIARSLPISRLLLIQIFCLKWLCSWCRIKITKESPMNLWSRWHSQPEWANLWAKILTSPALPVMHSDLLWERMQHIQAIQRAFSMSRSYIWVMLPAALLLSKFTGIRVALTFFFLCPKLVSNHVCLQASVHTVIQPG